MQGVGAAGLATVVGTPVLAGQEGDDGTVQNGNTALRVAHVSPDTPSVDIFLEQAGTDAGAGGGNETADGANTTLGDDNATAGGDNATAGGDNATGGDEGTPTPTDDEPLVSGLSYPSVSNYQEVQPGTYRLRIVAIENTGLIEGLFQEEEERVVFEGEVELQEGTPYTAVAFGELARATFDGTTPGGDAGTGGNATGGNATGDGAGDDTTGGTTDGQAGENQLVESLSFGEYQYVQLDPGEHTLQFSRAQAAGDGGMVGDDANGEDATGNETIGNETTGDDTAGNETIGNDTIGNETNGDDTAGNDTIGNETTGDDTMGDNATGNETVGDGEDTTGEQPGSGRAFQIKLLEDELQVDGTAGADDGNATGGNATAGGDDNATVGGANATGGNATGEEGTSRLRIFHAVPDVQALTVTRVSDQAAEGGPVGGNETDGAGDNDTAGVGGDNATAGGDNATGGADNATGGGDQGDGETFRQVQISTEAGAVYSGFATGYFNPSEAALAQERGAAGDNATAGGDNATAGGDNATLGEDNATAGAGNATGGDNATGGNETGGDDITIDVQNREFDFITVKDAQDGERTDGGTGGGLLSVSPPTALSD